MLFERFFIEGLACTSYLVGCEIERVAVVVDPDRDPIKYLTYAQEHRLRITHIIETHLHADHVSGNTELARRTGASIFIHPDARVTFQHTPLTHGNEVQVGRLSLRALHTPGHTPDGITFLVSDRTQGPQPLFALTGDTLFAGDIGRPDLVGAQAVENLAAQLHTTLFITLAGLPDNLVVYPGHGAGSLCGKSIRTDPSTTLGIERQENPAFRQTSMKAFVQYATHNLPEQPANHSFIKMINRRGPAILGDIRPQPLSIQQALVIFQQGAALIDLRDHSAFTERHIPGSIHAAWSPNFSNHIAQILPPQAPIVLLLAEGVQYRDVFYALARVGCEQVLGYLSEDLDTWQSLGLPVASGDIEDITPQQLQDLLDSGKVHLVDVREPFETRFMRIPQATVIPLGQLSSRIAELDMHRPTAVICQHGSRSQTGAAILGQSGFKKVYNVMGGMSAWVLQGLPVERG
jgi:glyoxylase-like metal-dependent hydrolase (beta-lactamase superfamily II)/rhodanese-related sulfurtransferase